MNRKIIGEGGPYLELEEDKEFTFFTTDDAMSACLNPQELLQVRDWINERVRELQFHGYIADAHLGD